MRPFYLVAWLFQDPESHLARTLPKALVLLVAVLSTLLVFLAYLLDLEKGGGNYTTGDWLINYAAGFVRRGLAGEIFIGLHDLTGLPLLWLTGLTQLAIYALFVGLSVRLFWALRPSGLLVVVMLSPAFILFGLFEYPGFLRKEVLGFCAMAIMGNALLVLSARGVCLLIAAAVAFFSFVIFAHEANVLFTPHLLLILSLVAWRRNVDLRVAVAAAGLVILLGGLAFVLSVLNSGIGQSAAICQAVTERGLSQEICDGAMRWLERDAGFGRQAVEDMLEHNNYLVKYGWGLTLALLPFLFFRPTRGYWRTQPLLMLVCVLPILPLFVVAVDWGRWVHMICTSSAILLLCLVHCGLAREGFGLSWLLVLPYSLTWSPTYVGSRSLWMPICRVKRHSLSWIDQAFLLWFSLLFSPSCSPGPPGPGAAGSRRRSGGRWGLPGRASA